MILKQKLKQLEESKAYKDFKKKNPDYYLVHCFTMHDSKDNNKGFSWEFGYYSKKKDKIIVFETVPKIKMRPEEEAFKKQGNVIALDMKKVKIGIVKALEKCHEHVSEEYKGQTVTKHIIILQNTGLDVYNITLVTMSFNIINVRIDSGNGEIISSNMQSIMNLRKE